MTDCGFDQAAVVEQVDAEQVDAGQAKQAAVTMARNKVPVQLKRKRHLRPRGTPTKVLNTPVRLATMEAIKRVAKQHNIGYGEVVDRLVRSAEKGRKGGG